MNEYERCKKDLYHCKQSTRIHKILSPVTSAPFAPCDIFCGYENTLQIYQVQNQDASADKAQILNIS